MGVFPKDFRTPEAKKWPEEYIPPETCGAIDDVQNALEHLRDANAQLRHAAHVWRHCAEDELRRRTGLGEWVARCREHLAEIRRIAKIHDAPANILAAIDAAAAEGLSLSSEAQPIRAAGEAEAARSAPDTPNQNGSDQ